MPENEEKIISEQKRMKIKERRKGRNGFSVYCMSVDSRQLSSTEKEE